MINYLFNLPPIFLSFLGGSIAFLFSVLGLWMVSSLFCMVSKGGFSLENLVEIARLYSSEIEYSEDNMQALLELFQ